ncbi:MAG: hypothetical protein COC12_05730 [Rhodobacteraceae bacterium]|nr:MAG: hypothetical protein COC12_05730 [Paracoccaceae bacterium]
MAVLIAISTKDFDPTEVAVPWRILSEAGVDVVFATDSGQVGAADPRMIDGNGFGILKPFLIANKSARTAYASLLSDKAFQAPIAYSDVRPEDFDALLLPGGHAKAVIPYLESDILHRAISGFFAADKPIGAICHGVVTACRATNPDTGKSVLYGRRTTALLKRQERLAYHLTRARLGDYYLTYPVTVEDEVRATLRAPADFIAGPTPVLRDDKKHLNRGFTVRDGMYLSARWPGDIHRFSFEFLKMLDEYQART